MWKVSNEINLDIWIGLTVAMRVYRKCWKLISWLLSVHLVRRLRVRLVIPAGFTYFVMLSIHSTWIGDKASGGWCDRQTNIGCSRLTLSTIVSVISVNAKKHPESLRSAKKHWHAWRTIEKALWVMEHAEWRAKCTRSSGEQIYSTCWFLNPRVWSNGKTLAIMSKGPWFDSGCAHFWHLFCSASALSQCSSCSLYCLLGPEEVRCAR